MLSQSEKKHSCSIRGERELSLEWDNLDLSSLKNKRIFSPEKVLYLRCKNMGPIGLSVIKLEEKKYLATNISRGSGLSVFVEASSLEEAVLSIFEKSARNVGYQKEDFFDWGEVCSPPVDKMTWKPFTWAQSETLTQVELAVKQMFNENKAPEEMGLHVVVESYEPYNNPFFTTSIPGLFRKTFNPDDCIWLTTPMRLAWEKKCILDKKAEWESAILSGGTTIVISCKGMAKTEVPNGTLVEFGTHPDMVLPDGTKLIHKSYGSGRNFGYSYVKGEKIDLSQINVNQYWVAFSQPESITDRIFGSRNGEAQKI